MEFSCRPLGDDRLALRADGPGDASWRDVLGAWERGIGVAFARCLGAVPYRAAYWESPPLTAVELDAPFAGVVIDAPPLARAAPEPGVFAEHFDGSAVVAFDNLGADALLVAPAPRPGVDASHLLAFCRSASDEQVAALFALVARSLVQRLDRSTPTWLSTSGLGVAWLHVRLDARPKYYQHGPYRRWTGGAV